MCVQVCVDRYVWTVMCGQLCVDSYVWTEVCVD